MLDGILYRYTDNRVPLSYEFEGSHSAWWDDQQIESASKNFRYIHENFPDLRINQMYLGSQTFYVDETE